MKIYSYLEFLLNEAYKFNNDIEVVFINDDDNDKNHDYFYGFVTTKGNQYVTIFSKSKESNEFTVLFSQYKDGKVLDFSLWTQAYEWSDVFSGVGKCVSVFVTDHNIKSLKYKGISSKHKITGEFKNNRNTAYKEYLEIFKDEIFKGKFISLDELTDGSVRLKFK